MVAMWAAWKAALSAVGRDPDLGYQSVDLLVAMKAGAMAVLMVVQKGLAMG